MAWGRGPYHHNHAIAAKKQEGKQRTYTNGKAARLAVLARHARLRPHNF